MINENVVQDSSQSYITIHFNEIDCTAADLANEQVQVINNVLIKNLSDGPFYIIDSNEEAVEHLRNVSVLSLETDEIDAPTESLVLANKHQVVADIQPSNNCSSTVRDEDLPVENTAVDATYVCIQCNAHFSDGKVYKRHLIEHRNEKKYCCGQCDLSFYNEQNLNLHETVHGSSPFECFICKTSFQRIASFKSHILVHQVEENIICNQCGAEAESEEEWLKHLNSHIKTEPKRLRCRYCNVKFTLTTEYREHMRRHSKVNKLLKHTRRKTHERTSSTNICPICQKGFSRGCHLIRHLRIHTGEKPFKCTLCEKRFTQKNTLQIHLSKHTGEKPFSCSLCFARFNQKCNLLTHVRKTHSNPEPGSKLYKCSYCSCMYKSTASLNLHIIRMHSNDPNSKKDDITAVMDGLQNKSNFVRVVQKVPTGDLRHYAVKHTKINDVRWYLCTFCKRMCKKLSDLVRHLRTHTKEKPHVCESCGATFALKTTLQKHFRRHAEQQNFQCRTCGKKFHTIQLLNVHLRKHTAVLKCSKCFERFFTLEELNVHQSECTVSAPQSEYVVSEQPLVKTASGLLFPLAAPAKSNSNEKKYQCSLCSSRFNKLHNYKRHMSLHDNNKRFKCEQCTRSYTTAYSLKEHWQRWHSDIKNFACSTCKKRFCTLSLLKRHQLIHSTNKPYACPHCHKFFKSVLYCRRHMRTHRIIQKVLPEQKQTPSHLEELRTMEEQQDIAMSPSTTDNMIIPLFATDDCFDEIEAVEVTTCKVQIGDNLFLNALEDLNSVDFDTQMFPQDMQTTLNCDEFPTTVPGPLMTPQIAEELPNITKVNDAIQEEEKLRGDFVCDGCGKHFTTLCHYRRHVPVHIKDRYVCKFCNRIFKKSCDLKRHERTHTGEKPYACQLCSKSFAIKSTLDSHMKVHDPSRRQSVKCDVCDVPFASKSSLNMHMNVHLDVKPYACCFCGRAFRTMANKRLHERTHGYTPDGVPIESVSNKVQLIASSDDSVTNLLAHMAMEAANDDNNTVVELTIPESADVQEELFFESDPDLLQQLQSSGLLMHDQILTNDMDNSDTTGVTTVFGRPRVSDPEMKICTDRELICDICQKRYASSDVLRKHRKRHGLDKSFVCNICLKGFDSSYLYEQHMRVNHAGARPFSCSVCDNTFAKKHHLIAHAKRMHLDSFLQAPQAF